MWRIGRTLNSFKRSARACRYAYMRGLRKMASLTHSTLSGVRADNGRPCGLLSFTDPYWRHFDTHNSRVLWVRASCLWNCWRKPRCAAVRDYFDKRSSAAVRCCTDQLSISTKLQTSLCIMTVRTKAARSWHVGFRISKTVTCLWLTLVSACVEVCVSWQVKLQDEQKNISLHLYGMVIT